VNKIKTKSNNSNIEKIILESEYFSNNINKSSNKNNNKNRVFDKNNNNERYIDYE